MNETVSHFGIFDLIIVIFYLAGTVVVGLLVARGKIKTDEDFALDGRRLGPIWLSLTAFASWAGLAGTFGTPENVYKFGLSGTWWFMGWLPGIILMAYLLAARLRKRLHITVPDAVANKYDKYGPSVRIATSLVTSWNYLAWAACQVFALSLIFNLFTGISPIIGAIIAFLIVILYTLLGGFRAVVITDVIQALIMLSVIMIAAPILVLVKGGGWTVILSKTRDIPDFYTVFKGAGTKTLIVWLLSLFPAAFIDPGGLQRVFAAKDPGTAKRGLLLSALFYFFFGIAITFLGIASRAILPSIEANMAMPALMSKLLPTGLLGLVIAAFLATAMSTADTSLLIVASTLQRDIYAHFRPNITEKERLIVNRILIVLLGLIALVVALKVPSVVSILLLGFSIYVPGLLLPVLAASFNLNLPNWAMLSTIIIGAGLSAIWVILKEPLVPAIVIGLVASVIPFSIGVATRKGK